MRHGLYLLGLLTAAGCNPYQNLGGDFYLGAVDATNFQPPYLGAGFTATRSVGTISPSLAGTKGGGAVGYYPFPTVGDPTIIDVASGGGTASIYIFDGDDGTDTNKCKPPSKNYVYDVQRDYVNFNFQGNVFEDESPVPVLPVVDTDPNDPPYVPVYAEVPVTSNGENCQSIHSAENLVKDKTVTVATGPKPIDDPSAHATGNPDGKYLAIAMIDPRAEVLLPDGSLGPNFLGATRWGYYNHYLAGYLEGGQIPTAMATMPDPNGGPDIPIIVAKLATLLAPNTSIDPKTMMPVGCDTADPTDPAAPCIGLGADLLEGVNGADATRGASGYSPICHIRTFTPADPTMPPLDPGDVDPASLDPDAGAFVYCLQVSQ
jgi:hypothetical protein